MSASILVQKNENGVTVLTVNRPEALNALNTRVLCELDAALDAIESDESCRVVVLTGAGEKAFVAGADIPEMREMTPAQASAFSLLGQNVFSRIKRLSQPVIAAVNGYALGGGCELAMAADLRIASENARFGQPEINLGIIPGFGGTVRLTRLVGPAKAREMILTGAPIDAQEAHRVGLINRVVAPGKSLESALGWAAELASKAPVALAMAKGAMRESWDLPVDRAMEVERERFASTFESADQKEGMAAFLEKRKPNFRGK